jgi:hypothetical protein
MHEDIRVKGNPTVELVNRDDPNGESLFIQLDHLMKIIKDGWHLRNLPINKRDREFISRGKFPPVHVEKNFAVDLTRNEDD